MIKVKDWQLELLRGIERYLENCYWNAEQKEYKSPFGNNGTSITMGDDENKVTIRAYNWIAENDWNLKYKDIKIYWYKYLGRATGINKELTPVEWINLYYVICDIIYEYFGKYAPGEKR